MGNYHETGPGIGYFLYTNGNQIFFRSRNGDAIGRAILLAMDYKKSFSSILYHNSIYYCYVNDKNQFVLRSTKENSILYHLEQREDGEFATLKMALFQKKIWIVICEKTNDSYRVQCICPFSDDIFYNLSFQSNLLPDIQLTTTTNSFILTLTTDFSETCYIMDEQLRLQEFKPQNNSSNTKELPALQEELQGLHGQLQAQSRIIQRQQEMIESATSQYNELMTVASRYKEEAIKWRSKFSKETLPGH